MPPGNARTVVDANQQGADDDCQNQGAPNDRPLKCILHYRLFTSLNIAACCLPLERKIHRDHADSRPREMSFGRLSVSAPGPNEPGVFNNCCSTDVDMHPSLLTAIRELPRQFFIKGDSAMVCVPLKSKRPGA